MELIGGRGYARIDVDSANLHCMAANLAVALDYYGYGDARACFGSIWHFDFSEDAGGAIELSPMGVDIEMEQQTGYGVVRLESGDDLASVVIACVAEGRPVLVCADAFSLPWFPQFNREHGPHWFLVEGIDVAFGALQIVDASDVWTRWGRARPTRAAYSIESARAAIAGLDADQAMVCEIRKLSEPRPTPPARAIADNCARILQTVGEQDAIGRFGRWFRDRDGEPEIVERFTHNCWLTARARRLHLLWLGELETVPAAGLSAFQASAVSWQRTSASAFVAARRQERGEPARAAAFDALDREVGDAEVRAATALLRDG